MRIIRRLRWLAGLIVFIISCVEPRIARPALAGSPAEAIKETIDEVFSILHDPALRGEEKTGKRKALLREAVAARFDFREMAKRALGPYWKHHAAKQDQFVFLFTELLAVVYLDTIEQGVEVEVLYLREYADGEYAHVDTKVVPSGGEGLEVSYKLHVVEGEWKAYDILVEHMSIVQNYRNQFYHILARRSFNELLDMMRKKIEKLRRSSS